MFMELYREEKREKGGGQEDKGVNQKERQIEPVINSLSVLHCLEHTKRFTELSREEKEEGGDRGDGGEKGKSKGGESSQASNLTPK